MRRTSLRKILTEIRPQTDCTSPGLFNLELIATRMREGRLIFGIFPRTALAEAAPVRDRSSLSRLMISEAYRLACRASFLRIRRDLCKFVLSATRLVTTRGESVAVSPILIFAADFRMLCFDRFLWKYFTVSFDW